MNKFIHRENLALFKKRLADPSLVDAQRNAILRLLSEEQTKASQVSPSAQEDER
jgi:hypothetical protein